jgi:hypothetical protein
MDGCFYELFYTCTLPFLFFVRNGIYTGMLKVFFVGACTLIAVGVFAFLVYPYSPKEAVYVPPSIPSSIPTPIPTPLPTPIPILPVRVMHDVPFTVQAPTANWGDPMYQNACEEASILMAARWISGKGLLQQEALLELKSLSALAEKLFGYYLDESGQDTATLAKEYIPHATVTFIQNASIKTIMEKLAQGNVVLVPANGKKLHNPNFKQPGPLRHMLLIRGYDTVTNEFVTNDPGTRNGNGYRYPMQVLFDAMHTYDTGDTTPVHPTEKVMIVVGPL